tara:strand:+ start:17 stop:406 length:390 start_codon:yes stop_codon:yes gene_type:complete
MKKLFKIIFYPIGFLMVIGLIIIGLEKLGIKEPSKKQEISDQLKKNREVYLTNWKKVIPYRGEFVGNTFIVHHKNKNNNFKNKDNFSMEYHPEVVFKNVTCEDIGIEYIQVRSIHHDDLLSGTRCEKIK